MKLTPTDKRIMDRMAPGALCGEGFLGLDHRDLTEIVQADAAAVDSLGLTHEQLGHALEEVRQAATAGLGTPVAVGQGLTAVLREAMGPIACPWGGCGVFDKGEVELTGGGRRIRFTPLSVHLIFRHGFYQGRGSRYRIAPPELARMLGVTPTSR
ncbi:hypothetical protein LCGC14_1439100 [marine sediment metagenome]|uniref:Uncharacterized protein n=1 Tax=marine sediment metagenome TaxID=412755 RepID=A0A0F9JLS0_9ZZZZ